jgi:hypothetical protein
MAELFILPFTQALDSDGNPISGAKLLFNLTGTTTPATVYANSTLATPLSNPVVADAAGRFPSIYLDPAITYRVRLFTAADVQVGNDVDPYGILNSAMDVMFTQVDGTSRTVQAKLRETPSSADYATTAALIAANRTARKVLTLSTSLEVLAAPVVLGLDAPTNNVGLLISGAGWNLTTPSASSGWDGSALTSSIISLNRPFPSETINNAPIVLENLAVIGGAVPKTVGNSQNGIGGSATAFEARNLLVQNMGGHGIDLNHSFSSKVEGGLYFGNFKNGVNVNDAFNNATLERVRAFANGRNFTTANQFNIAIGGTTNNYSPALIDCDVSYSGYTAWSYANGLLASIVVSGGVATITTVPDHGLSTGNFVSVRTAAFTGLSTTTGAAVTVTGAKTFTIATTASNGSYPVGAVPDIRIGPHSTGLLFQKTAGGRIEGLYIEDTQGLGAYIADNTSISITGGFVLNSDVIIENCRGVDIAGVGFTGEARLITNELNNRATLNVSSSCTFDSGASWTRGAYFMLDGQRYGPAIPTTGTWALGETLLNSEPAVGEAAGWVCTVAGTPGTWQPFGPVGQSRAAAQTDSVAATVGALVTDFNALMAKLRAANVMA